MTPEQKVKFLILALDARWQKKEALNYTTMTGVDADTGYAALVEAGEHWDSRNETRCGDVETDIPCDGGRHYEAKSVAAQLPDGSWVGWTYYYGGGKHAEPEAIDWMSEAYELDCVEEEKVVTVRTFTKQAPVMTSTASA
ncbi:hypothetical protein ACIPIN_02090 [Pseudomonas sp. NPDC087697]|uniref:hypothetical protein n=1 Tax=Pseudomonas sp. NPDC087697 TaxID=3364447 RepID=UPI0038014618